MVRGSKQQHASFAKGGRFFINSSRKSYAYNAWFCIKIELSSFFFLTVILISLKLMNTVYVHFF